LFKISEFARLSKVSLKTLRYYDHIGILTPCQVNDDTGYRYYSAEQLLELNRILFYKDLGFTLPQIKQLLHENITLEHMQGMLKLKRSEIQQIINTEQAKLERIEARMRLIETNRQINGEPVITIKAEEERFFLYQTLFGKEEDIPTLLYAVQQSLTTEICTLIQGAQVVLWKESEHVDAGFEFEIGYFLKAPSDSVPAPFQCRMLEAEPLMATLAFHSSTSFDGAACVHVAQWIEQHHYQIKEHEYGRELYIPLLEEDTQLVEIQIPIVPR